jgi:hypothetical protein
MAPQEHFSAPEPASVTNMIRTQDDNPTRHSRHEEDAEDRGEASGDARLAQWCRTTCDWPERVSRSFISRLFILRCSLLLFLIVVLLSYNISNLTLLSSCQPRIATYMLAANQTIVHRERIILESSVVSVVMQSKG